MKILSSVDDDSGYKNNYIASTIFALIVIIPLTYWLAPGLIPFSFTELWNSHGTGLWDWLSLGVPLFIWGATLSLGLKMIRIIHGTSLDIPLSRAQFFGFGTVISAGAGLLEEIAFRWLLFFSAFTGLAILNFFFFDFAGFGLIEWIQSTIFLPLANFVTFGEMKLWLLDKGWLFGGAILSSNAFFRNSHDGLFQSVNAWFLGMFFFYVTFTHGLLAAIILHALYDLVIFTVCTIFYKVS